MISNADAYHGDEHMEDYDLEINSQLLTEALDSDCICAKEPKEIIEEEMMNCDGVLSALFSLANTDENDMSLTKRYEVADQLAKLVQGHIDDFCNKTGWEPKNDIH